METAIIKIYKVSISRDIENLFILVFLNFREKQVLRGAIEPSSLSCRIRKLIVTRDVQMYAKTDDVSFRVSSEAKTS